MVAEATVSGFPLVGNRMSALAASSATALASTLVAQRNSNLAGLHTMIVAAAVAAVMEMVLGACPDY